MCSDNCTETSSDVDDEPDGSDSASVMDEPMNNDTISSEDAVEFGCIQVYHHIAVDDDDEREFEDGREPSRDGHESESGDGDEPYPNRLYHDEDGHRWTYDVYANECDDPSNCESPANITGRTGVKSLHLGLRRRNSPTMVRRRNSPTMVRRRNSPTRKDMMTVNRHMNEGDDHQQVVVRYFISILIFVKPVLILLSTISSMVSPEWPPVKSQLCVCLSSYECGDLCT
jgi:hypothetical protein